MNDHRSPATGIYLVLGLAWWTVLALLPRAGMSGADPAGEQMLWVLVSVGAIAASGLYLWAVVAFRPSSNDVLPGRPAVIPVSDRQSRARRSHTQR